MKKIWIYLCLMLFTTSGIFSQRVAFEEYTLNNGLHVILQQDKSAPVVTTSVMYHVGAKDEENNRTGFAHFFEHLLFEGTENIGRGEWFKIVASNGGQNNANTTSDRTYYYETFPSNNLQLGLWLESERMMHAIINPIGVSTQNGVVKQEKRLRVDNRPYGNLIASIQKELFVKHPYRNTVIGLMEDLDAATLEEFRAFYKKYYVPNNAVLVVAGDFEKEQTKKWIKEYFEPIAKGNPVVRETYVEDPILKPITSEHIDPNINIPAYVVAYRTPSMKDNEAYVLEMISNLLSSGKSSRLYRKLVDQDKVSLDIGAFNYSQEDYGMYIVFGLPMPNKTKEEFLKVVDNEILDLQTNLISEKEYEKLQNQMEQDYVNQNSSTEAVAENLAKYYLLYKDINLINDQLNIYKSITREDIRNVAKKYLNTNQRLVLDYLPKSK